MRKSNLISKKVMIFPDNLQYTREHEWLLDEETEAIIGITEYAQKELGEIVYVDIDSEGEELAAGERFGTIEAVKAAEDLFMPVCGTILAVNPVLESAPDTVNKDPYGEGWMVRIKLTNRAELENLISAKVYEEFIKT